MDKEESFIESIRNRVQEEIKTLKIKLQQAEAILRSIDKVETPSTNAVPIIEGLKEVSTNQKTWIQRIVDEIVEVNHVLSSGEIINRILIKDSSISREKAQSSISATISLKVSKGQVLNRKLIGGDYYIGLIEWFDSNDNIIEEYKIKKETQDSLF